MKMMIGSVYLIAAIATIICSKTAIMAPGYSSPLTLIINTCTFLLDKTFRERTLAGSSLMPASFCSNILFAVDITSKIFLASVFLLLPSKGLITYWTSFLVFFYAVSFSLHCDLTLLVAHRSFEMSVLAFSFPLKEQFLLAFTIMQFAGPNMRKILVKNSTIYL